MNQKADTEQAKRPVRPKAEQHTSPRQWAYLILEEGQTEGGVSRVVEMLLIALIVSNTIAVILETVPALYNGYRGVFTAFEQITVYIFAVEYFFRLWSCVEDPRVGTKNPVRGRFLFALRPMMVVDFLSFAPYFIALAFGAAVDLRALRVLRLLRLLKIARYSQAMPALLGVLYAERRALFGAFILLIFTVCVTAEVMHLIEGSAQPKVFGTLPGSMYWAITTLTTVGYGDETPITWLGKLWAGITMVTGLVLFALPVGIIATGFVNGLHKREFSITWSMVKRQPLFDGFEMEATRQILDTMGASVVQDHTRITVEGQKADMFYLIISGKAHAEDESGSWDLEAGDMIGEEALNDHETYKRTIWARTEMRMMNLMGEDLRRMARKYPLLGQRIRNEVPW
ncbi:MAG TPA: cyclic nucleotide-gated ion channel [Rhizomicrobium sp.]|jgi:voltage-gated potassium channel|nr:cyclic nucleotide-gated ion channel [Rhizomicrobium sp.]